MPSDGNKMAEDAWRNCSIRSLFFKRWFGDWESDTDKPGKVSKVVDNLRGRPLQVFHGSYADFDIFDKEKLGSNHPVIGKLGFFFAPDKRQAIGAQFRPIIYEGFLNIRNPYRLYVYGDTFDAIVLSVANIEQFVQKLRTNKYDGIAVIDANSNIAYWVAFEANQFKAINNKGTFEKENPNMLRFETNDPMWEVFDLYEPLQELGLMAVYTNFERPSGQRDGEIKMVIEMGSFEAFNRMAQGTNWTRVRFTTLGNPRSKIRPKPHCPSKRCAVCV